MFRQRLVKSLLSNDQDKVEEVSVQFQVCEILLLIIWQLRQIRSLVWEITVFSGGNWDWAATGTKRT